MLIKCNARMRLGGFEQRALDFLARHIIRVHDAVPTVTAFARQVQRAIALTPRKSRSTLDKRLHRRTRVFHHHSHRAFVAQVPSRDARIPHVLIHRIQLIHYRANPTLRVRRRRLERRRFRDNSHIPYFGCIERIAQSRDPAPDNGEIHASARIRDDPKRRRLSEPRRALLRPLRQRRRPRPAARHRHRRRRRRPTTTTTHRVVVIQRRPSVFVDRRRNRLANPSASTSSTAPHRRRRRRVAHRTPTPRARMPRIAAAHRRHHRHRRRRHRQRCHRH